MISNDPAVWWAAFGAISQAIGAAATFAAVGVSLWIVLSERRMRATGSAGIRVMFAGDGTPGTYMVGIEILNVGVRAFQVTGVGWRTGWLWRAPKVLCYRFALQNTNIMLNQRPGPHIVEPGRSEGFYTTVADMQRHKDPEAKADLFDRTLPIIGNAPIRAMIHISGRKPLIVSVSNELANFLRGGKHTSTTAEED